MFNVAIIGTDGAENFQTFVEKCIYYLRPKASEGITIFSIEENSMISDFAAKYKINVQIILPDWYTFGKGALSERNKRLISLCNGVRSFEDGRKDTNIIKKMASDAGLPVKKVKRKSI